MYGESVRILSAKKSKPNKQTPTKLKLIQNLRSLKLFLKYANETVDHIIALLCTITKPGIVGNVDDITLDVLDIDLTINVSPGFVPIGILTF